MVVVIAKEKNFENRIKDFLKNSGCWFVKYWGGGEFTKSGVPDILCCCDGFFLGIEVKSATGKPSELQLYNLKKIDEAGGLAILLYPKDFNTFKNLIHLIGDGDEKMWEVYNQLKGRWKQ